ncbi:MAG: hypothetical protein R6V23_16265 [Bacteroidales bacterium]
MEPTQTIEQTVTFWIDRVELVNLQTYYNQVEILEVINRSNGKALVKVKIS